MQQRQSWRSSLKILINNATQNYNDYKKSIEADRERALKRVHDEHWGGGVGGGFCD